MKRGRYHSEDKGQDKTGARGGGRGRDRAGAQGGGRGAVQDCHLCETFRPQFCFGKRFHRQSADAHA